jgi:3-hydroxybutyryl-CoA dehydrogenase
LSERLAIIGGGTIACGLAAVAVRGGPVTLFARSGGSAARAEETFSDACSKLDEDVDRSNFQVTTDIDAVREATFVIEAVTEDLEVKRQVLATLDERLPPQAVLATTTSSLPVGALAEASGRPGRLVGFHVFNPVVRMPLVELAFPAQTELDARERAHGMCERLGKRAVEVPDRPGFVVNRLLFPYLFAAVRLAEEAGLEAEQLDACMTLGAGHPMGPLALLDFIGLDVAEAIGESLAVEVPGRLRALVAEGALGRKSGRGFYGYDE